jgi:hypothetical protein
MPVLLDSAFGDIPIVGYVVIYLVCTLLPLLILWLIIKTAVLAALREHARETRAATASPGPAPPGPPFVALAPRNEDVAERSRRATEERGRRAADRLQQRRDLPSH